MKLRCEGVNKQTLRLCGKTIATVYRALDGQAKPLCRSHARSRWAKLCGYIFPLDGARGR